MISATRRIQFCAGHRIEGHEGKCRHLHGHNYVALLTAVGVDADLDGIGRVIDFSVLKERVGGWVEANWDHGFLHANTDHGVRRALTAFGATKSYPMPYNPTAENMARYLLEVVGPEVLSGTAVKLVKVELWETENCKASVTE